MLSALCFTMPHTKSPTRVKLTGSWYFLNSAFYCCSLYASSLSFRYQPYSSGSFVPHHIHEVDLDCPSFPAGRVSPVTFRTHRLYHPRGTAPKLSLLPAQTFKHPWDFLSVGVSYDIHNECLWTIPGLMLMRCEKS